MYVCGGVALLLIAVGLCIYLLTRNKTSPNQESNELTPVFESIDESTPVGSRPLLMLFYASWCGHSKRFLPVWEQIKQGTQGAPFDVDQTEDDSLATEHGVQGFPTLKFYPDGFGSPGIEYTGERSPEAILNFVSQNLGISSNPEPELTPVS